MDKFDNQIIDLLRRDARMSVSDIAREVSLSRSAVTARIKSSNRIKSFWAITLRWRSRKNNNVCAYFALKFDTSASLHSCERYAEKLYQIPGIKWCHAISGETDLMLYVEVESMAELNAIRDELQLNPQLRNLMTHAVLKEFLTPLSRSE